MDEIKVVGGTPKITEIGRTMTIQVDREVMSRLMKKGEAYSQIKQYIDAHEGDAVTLAKIRELIKTTEIMME